MRHKLHCKQLLSPLLSLVLVSMLLPRANAENGAATRTVRVAFPEQAGMSIIGHEGKVTGCNYDHLEKISEYTGWQMDYIAYPDDDGTAAVIRVLQDLEDGKVDLVGPLLKNKATEALYEFPERSYGMAYTTLCALASGDLRETNIKLHGKLTVGLWEQAVTRNSEVIAYLDAERFDYELIYYPTAEAQTQALYDGSVDLISSVSLSPITNTRIVEQFAARPFYFAATKGNTALIEELDAVIFALLYARQMSKLEAKDVEFHEDSADLHDIAVSCAEIVEARATEGGLTLETGLPDEFHPPRVLVSERHLRQIFMNLIGNAIKYTHSGGTVRITAETLAQTEDSVTCRFSVSDTGIGMSKAFQSKMFEPFAQE